MRRPSWNRLCILQAAFCHKLGISAAHENRLRMIRHRLFVWSMDYSIEALKGTEATNIRNFNGEANGNI